MSTGPTDRASGRLESMSKRILHHKVQQSIPKKKRITFTGHNAHQQMSLKFFGMAYFFVFKFPQEPHIRELKQLTSS